MRGIVIASCRMPMSDHSCIKLCPRQRNATVTDKAGVERLSTSADAVAHGDRKPAAFRRPPPRPQRARSSFSAALRVVPRSRLPILIVSARDAGARSPSSTGRAACNAAIRSISIPAPARFAAAAWRGRRHSTRPVPSCATTTRAAISSSRFKRADRLDLVPAFANWLARAGRALLDETDLIVPVPLHRSRLWQRRYNQSALLAQELSRRTRPRRRSLPARAGAPHAQPGRDALGQGPAAQRAGRLPRG